IPQGRLLLVPKHHLCLLFHGRGVRGTEIAVCKQPVLNGSAMTPRALKVEQWGIPGAFGTRWFRYDGDERLPVAVEPRVPRITDGENSAREPVNINRIVAHFEAQSRATGQQAGPVEHEFITPFVWRFGDDELQ